MKKDRMEEGGVEKERGQKGLAPQSFGGGVER